MKRAIANIRNRSLWDSVYDMSEEMDDITLFELGMDADDIDSFYNMGLCAYRKDNIVFVMNDLFVVAIYEIEEFIDIIKKGNLVEDYQLEACVACAKVS